MTEIKYRTLDTTDPADIQEGDRVTLEWECLPGDHFRGIARPSPFFGGNLWVGGHSLKLDNLPLAKNSIVKIERPIAPIPTKLGAVALPKDSPLAPLARIGCERWPWRNMDGEGFTDAAVQGRVDAGTHYIAFEGVDE